MVEQIQRILRDDAKLAVIWQEARKAGYERFRSYKNLCAATASGLLMSIGVLDKRLWLVSVLAKRMIGMGWVKITHPTDLKCGDLVITQDRNETKGPDHTFFVLEVYDAAPVYPALIFDNQSQKPSIRNLGRAGWYKGKYLGKTPMEYALRPPGASIARLEETKRKEAIAAFAFFYGLSKDGLLSQRSKELLNEFRYQPEFTSTE